MSDFFDGIKKATQQAKNIINGKDPNAPTPEGSDSRLDVTAQCKVLWYPWKYELPTDSKHAFNIDNLVSPLGSNSVLASADSYDISNHIENFTYTKSMQGAAGGFSFTLHNSFDWAKHMKPGQWICIYLSNEGDLPLPKEMSDEEFAIVKSQEEKLAKQLPNLMVPMAVTRGFVPKPKLQLRPGPSPKEIAPYKSKLRCLGLIQRVGVVATTSVDGAKEITYQITGKDFGAVYEETEIWFNANNAEAATFRNAIEAISNQFARNLTELLDKYHDIFVSPSSALAKKITDVKSFFPEQWVLPDRMVNDLGLKMKVDGKGTFGGLANLKEFSPTIFENPDPFPLAGLQGRCWDRLKTLSQPEFHELFTELSDAGNPKIFFRPIPWAVDTSRYATLSKVMLKFKDLASDTSVLPPLPINLNISSMLTSLADEALQKLGSIGNPPDIRIKHSVRLNAIEVESYNIGPDVHSRANFFLVDSMKSVWDQQNSFALINKNGLTQWPLRDEDDIRRHGFRPFLINLNSFNITNAQFFANSKPGNTPAQSFYKEASELIRDFYCNAEDLYTGTFALAAGRNDVKLGKVALTDESFDGIDNMVFYIEGYTDSFSVNMDGTASWTQTLNVTRGMEQAALLGGSTKARQDTKPSTFHSFKK